MSPSLHTGLPLNNLGSTENEVNNTGSALLLFLFLLCVWVAGDGEMVLYSAERETRGDFIFLVLT